LIATRFVCGGSLRGEQLWLTEKSAALQLAQLFVSEPLDASVEFGGDHRDAFLELVRQVAGVCATSWKAIVGGDPVISFHSAAEPAFTGSQETFIEVKAESFPDLRLRFQLNEELCQSISESATESQAEPASAHNAARESLEISEKTAMDSNTAGALPANL